MRQLSNLHIQFSGSATRPSRTHQSRRLRTTNTRAGLILLCFAYGCGSNSNGSNTTVGGTGGNTSTVGGAAGGSTIGGNSGQGGNTNSTIGGNTNNAGGAGGNSAGGNAGTGGSCCTISTACNDCLAKQIVAGGHCDASSSGLPLSDLPPCENMQGTNPYTGESNADLCKAVYSCVMNTQCAFGSLSIGASACYCGVDNVGTAADGSALCFSAQNGPCKQQIEDGMNLPIANPTKIAGLFGNPNVPSGMALYLSVCEVDYCSSECGVSYQNSGTGGAPGTGGAAGTGGASSTGGAGGAGGAATGGSTSRACDVSTTDTILYDFATDISSFTANTSSSFVTPTLTWDGSVGSAADGSMQVSIPFTNWGQQAEIDATLPSVMNLTNRTLFACVRLDSGLMPSDSTACGNVAVSVVANNSAIGNADRICPNQVGQWLQFKFTVPPLEPRLDSNGNPAFDSSGNPLYYFYSQNITSINVTIVSPNIAVTGSAPPSQATFHIDTIGYR